MNIYISVGALRVSRDDFIEERGSGTLIPIVAHYTDRKTTSVHAETACICNKDRSVDNVVPIPSPPAVFPFPRVEKKRPIKVFNSLR